MSPRGRSDKYAHLNMPENVKIHPRKAADGSVTLFFGYVFPNGREKSIGSDADEARQTAAALNAKFAKPDSRIARLLQTAADPQERLSRDPPIQEAITEFDREWIQKQEYSASYLAEVTRKLTRLKTEWHGVRCSEFDTYRVNQFLRGLSQEAARQHRTLMDRLFRYLLSAGYYRGQNPVADILPIAASTRVRMRHTWDGYQCIHKTAEPWLQDAMGLAVYSLQRRADLVMLDRAQVDLKRRTIQIEQGKTGVFLEIIMGDELYEVVYRMMTSPILCPKLIKRRPDRQTKKQRESKPHPFAVTPNYLSKAFKKARDPGTDTSKWAYPHLEPNQRPSLHDLRAFGIFAHFKAGYSIEYIQALAGHADKAMTEHYRQGHEKRKPVRVEAGLSLAAVDWNAVDWESDLLAEMPKALQELVDSDE